MHITKEAQRNKYCFLNSLFSFYFCSQIDDKEFDIPQVDTPPTLESILNEVKYMLLFDCYTTLYLLHQTLPTVY